jgi:hypothetical protein
MNIRITPATETLLPQVMALGYPSPEAAIEAAVLFFYDCKISNRGNVATDTATSEDPAWSAAEISTSVQDLLDDPEEDIYTLEDGEPVDDPTPTR